MGSNELTFREYVSKVFKQSLVTGVSNIVACKNRRHKVFKSIVLTLCLIGFSYQVVEYLLFVFTFPSVVDITIESKDEYLSPSYTFCNTNGIKRSKYCAKYPENCYKPKRKEFFKIYPHYKGQKNIKNFMIPKKDYYYIEYNTSRQELIELGHDIDSLLLNNYWPPENITGPYFRDREYTLSLFGCYTINSRVDNRLPPVINKKISPYYPIDTFVFDLEEEELFHPDAKAQLLFALHSPFKTVDPDFEGYALKPGMAYNIHLRLEEERRLKSPYKTDCINYTETWLKANMTGPRMKETCEEECYLKFYIHCNNATCVPSNVLFPHNLPPCPIDHLYEPNPPCPEERIIYSKCLDSCKVDCTKIKFEYHILEREITETGGLGNRSRNPRHTYVDVFFSENEVLTWSHRPQYKEVEVFSYIGGFMGWWLGISLVAILDFLESIFRIIVFACSRRHRKSVQRGGNI